MSPFIFATRTSSSLAVIGEGMFHCPSCKDRRAYQLIERIERGRFLLFLVIEGATLGTHVECTTCRKQFPSDCLRQSSGDELKVVNEIRERLKAGYSAQVIKGDLFKAGVDDRLAKRYIEIGLGISKRNCPQCESIYHSAVTRCMKCGVPLPKQYDAGG